ncbi:MAG: phosphoribosylformylglycinamidine synthase subunit PurQ, partial [Calditrichia bacterium]
VFGLMPHPERHIHCTQHPYWTRIPKKNEGDGLKIFRNGVEFMRNI